MSDLGRLRILARRLGLPRDLWTDQPPEVERGRLIDYLTGLVETLDQLGMPPEEYALLRDLMTRPDDEDVILLPDPDERRRRR